MKKEINWVCRECGISANVLTCLKRYGRRPNKPAFDVSTMKQGECDLCSKKDYLLPIRDVFYPEFDLLDKVAKLLK